MVVQMPSQEFRASSASNNDVASDLRLPVFKKPTVEPWPMNMSWEQAVRIFAATREHYMREFDSPEKRWRDKNPTRFCL
jgi:hypothetical protein